jgi:energy-coupling factor transporter ATP-binding protein EcfA2
VALGITDYFCLRCYKEFVRRRKDASLPAVALVFPNIELRLTIETKERKGINIHLLVSPDDPDHISRIEEKLTQLKFAYRNEVYPCTEDALRRLGRVHRKDPKLDDGTALAEGANQFKVELGDLRRLSEGDSWFRSNVLVAVAAGNDGLAGLSGDAAFHSQREELGRFAQVVFSGSPADRTYWLGNHPDFATNGQTPKPCLHGCDAHDLDSVLEPQRMRRCWIRAEPSFEGLRQTVVEPARRVHIGDEAPNGPSPCDAIRFLRLRNAAWLQNEELELNSGLVTIIGAKGSGKTALADLLALGTGTYEVEAGPASFIAKAGDLLQGLEVEVEWGDSAKQVGQWPNQQEDNSAGRVLYLSQQFVERLCAPSGLAEPLVEEIERVVFSAIRDEDRLECSTFSELRSVMLESPRSDCRAGQEAIRANTRLVADETKVQRSAGLLRAKLNDAERASKAIEKEIAAIPVKAGDAKVKAQRSVAAKLKALKDAIASEERRGQDLHAFSGEVQRQVRAADSAIQELKTKYPSLLGADVWALLRLQVPEDALRALTRLETEARKHVLALREHGLPEPSPAAPKNPANAQKTKGLAELDAENEELTKALGLDQANAKRRAELEKRLVATRKSEETLRKELAHAEKASERIKTAHNERLKQYDSVFTALVAEQEALGKLYEPLQGRLSSDNRLTKLSFSVQRVVALDSWVSRGEGLLDLRKPPFNRRGMLAEIARASLLQAWWRGTPQEARDAMKAFVSQHANSALEALAQGVTPLDFGEWLFSTDHIAVRYGIQYEGVEVAHLSPGTRGVVLLMLYLGLDDWDRRPLVIDQPEENLDPRSVYADLVPFFRDAAKRRQIIMVTHNANLVVTTDSDQVIVAEAQRLSPTELPKMTYSAGGLEDPWVRDCVCQLLEGGEEAFRMRGRRYGALR